MGLSIFLFHKHVGSINKPITRCSYTTVMGGRGRSKYHQQKADINGFSSCASHLALLKYNQKYIYILAYIYF